MSSGAMGFEAFDSQEADYGEVDAMLDGLFEGSGDFLSERSRGRRGGGGRGVPAAQGTSAYRAPATAAYVTQTQLQEALTRVGTDIRRNGEGIKGLNSRVDDIVVVNRVQSREIGKLGKQMKIDGALELAEAFTFPAAGGAQLDVYRVLRGAVKSGVLGDPKGALGNPWVVGGGAL